MSNSVAPTATALLDRIRIGLIRDDEVLEGPYSPKRIVYADCAHATGPLPPRMSTTGSPAPAQSHIPPITSTATAPRATSSSAACRDRLPARQITTRGRACAPSGRPAPPASADNGR
jgi:hypothetical protein